MLDSLVRVSRRVVQGQTWKISTSHCFPKGDNATKVTCPHSSLIQQPAPTKELEVHHTAISHRRLPSVRLALSRDRFPFNNFTCYLTPFSKVLFIFPSRYLFAIGLLPIFSLGWNLPPIWAAFPKQLDSSTLEIHWPRVTMSRRGLSPSVVPPFQETWIHLPLPTCLEITIPTAETAVIPNLSSSRFTRRYWGNPC